MEWWNTGILEENNLGRDERLLVLGTQTRLRGYAYGGQARAPEPQLLFPHFIRRRRIRVGGPSTIPIFQHSS